MWPAKHTGEGCEAPHWAYGVSYDVFSYSSGRFFAGEGESDEATVVWLPVPLNLLVRVVRSVWMWLRFCRLPPVNRMEWMFLPLQQEIRDMRRELVEISAKYNSVVSRQRRMDEKLAGFPDPPKPE